jgi:hypothetical protein
VRTIYTCSISPWLLIRIAVVRFPNCSNWSLKAAHSGLEARIEYASGKTSSSCYEKKKKKSIRL